MQLIRKTILYYLLISLPLLIIAGITCYFLIKSELRNSTEEELYKEYINAKHVIQQLPYPHNIYLNSDSLSHIKISNYLNSKIMFTDTLVFDKNDDELLNHHVLKAPYFFKNTHYLITLSKTTLEEDDLLESLFTSFLLIVFFLIASFFLVSWLLSKTLWLPFYKTVTELNAYDIKKHEPYNFETSTTKEFNQLNSALNKMTKKLYSDFVQQKEFTENAAHEMQTPLAVVKANISLLMQSSNLKEEEMNQLQAVENTVKKLSALNKTLLLLTKIENNQFQENLIINLKETIVKVLSNYSDLIEAKQIKLELNLESNLKIKINPLLADILISNLFQNAIRHNYEGGKIIVLISGNALQILNTGQPLTINKEDLFTRFKKNDASKDSLGLGLSIVKSICNLYQLKIDYSYSNQLHAFTLQSIKDLL